MKERKAFQITAGTFQHGGERHAFSALRGPHSPWLVCVCACVARNTYV